jgi:ATP-dependent DNA helicase Q4
VSYRALDAARQAGQAAAAEGEERQQQAQETALRAAVERYFDDAEDAAGSSSSQQPGPAAASGWAAGMPEGSRANGSSCSSASLLLDTQGLPLKRAEPSLLQAARAVLRRNREQAGPALSGRALARILHGVGSPAFKPDPWHKRMGAFWGSQAHVDFGAVLAAAAIVGRDDA